MKARYFCSKIKLKINNMSDISIISNYDISHLNTFHVKAEARSYLPFYSKDDLVSACDRKMIEEPILVLGGGSNLLFTADFKGTIVHPCNKGIEIVENEQDVVFVRVQAGEIWDDFVAWACENDFWGVENLSLIPGNVGASPVQNIGAYGSEAKDAVFEVECFDLKENVFFTLSNDDCKFGYRDSIFKHTYEHAVVVSVIYKLSRHVNPQLSYSNLKDSVLANGEPNLLNIRNTIIKIREQKLPDPDKLGNAGSFFKNPVLDAESARVLLSTYPDAVHYNLANGDVKFAAGWLIDNAGLKGYKQGSVGVHQNQALVLVNYGGACGADIVKLAEYIQNTVSEKYGISLEPEVLYIS